MARMTVVTNGILPCQEAFLVDAPTPEASPRRWIQAKRAVKGRFPPATHQTPRMQRIMPGQRTRPHLRAPTGVRD